MVIDVTRVWTDNQIIAWQMVGECGKHGERIGILTNGSRDHRYYSSHLSAYYIAEKERRQTHFLVVVDGEMNNRPAKFTGRFCLPVLNAIEIAAIHGETDLRRFKINRRRPILPCGGAVSNCRRMNSQDLCIDARVSVVVCAALRLASGSALPLVFASALVAAVAGCLMTLRRARSAASRECDPMLTRRARRMANRADRLAAGRCPSPRIR